MHMRLLQQLPQKESSELPSAAQWEAIRGVFLIVPSFITEIRSMTFLITEIPSMTSRSMSVEGRSRRTRSGFQPKRVLSLDSVRSIDDSVHIKGPMESSALSSCGVKHDIDGSTRTFSEESVPSQIPPDNLLTFPKLQRTQVMEGKILGKGALCYVHEVRGFRNLSLIRRPSWKGNHRVAPVTSSYQAPPPRTLVTGLSSGHNLTRSVHSQQLWIDASERDLTEKGSEHEVDRSSQQSRVELLTHRCFREGGDARYAIKVFCTETMNHPQRLAQGLMDMANEARILSFLTDHPNIIQMRAICQETPFGEPCDNFILLDRLYDTLEKRIKTWKREVDELTGIRAHLSRRDPGGAKKVKLYEQRVTVAYDLSSALAYIHRNRIIHRDLKPDNMGFDIRGAIKVCCAADMWGGGLYH